MFSRHLIESATLRGAALELSMRLNWYRALPLSCVERLGISLDGSEVDPLRATLELAGVRRPAFALAAEDDTWWHVPETGTVRIDLDAVPDDGEHVVELVVGTRIPYLVDPAGNAVVIVDRARAAVRR